MRFALCTLAGVLYFSCLFTSIASQRLDFAADDSDLETFVSRPDLKPPKFVVHVRDPDKIVPGYWFVAPYDDLRDRARSKLFRPGQVGPHIYDKSGTLIWSGAHLFGDRTTFDFKISSCSDPPCMTFILHKDIHSLEHPGGAGLILNNKFEIVDTVLPTAGNGVMNMHEFTVTRERTAQMIIYRPQYYHNDQPNPEQFDRRQRQEHPISGWLGDNGFQEIDMATGRPLFQWWALDHINPAESMVKRPFGQGFSDKAWDWFHQNSIDKNNDGDYLISSRHFNSIYKISGKDGSIIWQLGGLNSWFNFSDGFQFSSQHDARFRFENATHTVISFLNNAADLDTATANFSSAVTVSLDLTLMKATLIDKWDRPDHELSQLRGNVQLLPNGNTFVCWSENSQLSEFDENGKLLLEAEFSSNRFVTYRAYKFNITARPSEPIALKSFIYGVPEQRKRSVTTLYTSWNGATEVVSWRFYGLQPGGDYKLIGETVKSGFETTLMVPGAICQVYVEAISRNGGILGNSTMQQSILPLSWPTMSCKVSTIPAAFQESKLDLMTSSNSILLLLGSFISILLVLLCLAGWKIRQLLLRLKINSGYDYTLLTKT